MKVINIKQAKEQQVRKSGTITPQALLENTLVNIDNIERAVIMVLDKSGEVKIGWSSGSVLEVLGVVEAAKTTMIESMYE